MIEQKTVCTEDRTVYEDLLPEFRQEDAAKLPALNELLEEEDGIGVVEVLLILVVLIALVLIFRTQITQLVSKIFTSINSKSANVYN